MATGTGTVNGMTVDEYLASLNIEESLDLVEKVLILKARMERAFSTGNECNTPKGTHQQA
ncbi:MAG: hypothetical protein FWD64_08460 [Acidobacteriaceae bacterium]|nr:hypothetical protein [Acidobacteriaceae bacterium]